MARKDNRGRNLKTGESQRKDGLYMYRYTDLKSGKRLTIYNADLAELRMQEKQIRKDEEEDIVTDQMLRKITVNQLFEQYMLSKQIAQTTSSNYKNMWKLHVKENLGNMKVVQVKPSHIKLFYADLSKKGLAHNTIKLIHNLLYPSFEMAIEDDLTRKNPCKNALKDYGAAPKDKEALTIKQQMQFIQFVKTSKVFNVYYPLFQIMLETGFRCGEVIGLTWKDVDMKKREISINHQLIYKDYMDGNGHCFHITTPKTLSGIRKFPMTDSLYKLFAEQRKQNFLLGLRCNVVIDGMTDFIFCTKRCTPIMPNALNNVLYNVVKAYNANEVIRAKKEKRKEELLPKFSAHVLRHTGCTRMAECGMDMKVVQYLMGHAHIDVTMDVYNHISEPSRIEKELEKYQILEG